MNWFDPKIRHEFSVKRLVVAVSVVLIVGYAIFNAKHIILGPSIEVMFPTTTETETTENMLAIKGRAKNTAFLSLNERQISADTEGFFEERLLLSEGFNIISIRAIDRFKKETQETLKVYYKKATSSTVYKEPSEKTSLE